MKKPLDPVKQFNGWMKNQLRRLFFRWWERSKAVKNAWVERGLYKCAACLKVMKQKGMHIDHIDPVVDPEQGFIDWDIYVSRLFCSADNLQLLCEPCHKIKTEKERIIRKQFKTGLYSPERAKNISKGRMGISEYTRPVIARNLITGSTRFFLSVCQAAKLLGLSSGHTYEACNGKRKHVKGWEFMYQENSSENIDSTTEPKL